MHGNQRYSDFEGEKLNIVENFEVIDSLQGEARIRSALYICGLSGRIDTLSFSYIIQASLTSNVWHIRLTQRDFTRNVPTSIRVVFLAIWCKLSMLVRPVVENSEYTENFYIPFCSFNIFTIISKSFETCTQPNIMKYYD